MITFKETSYPEYMNLILTVVSAARLLNEACCRTSYHQCSPDSVMVGVLACDKSETGHVENVPFNCRYAFIGVCGRVNLRHPLRSGSS